MGRTHGTVSSRPGNLCLPIPGEGRAAGPASQTGVPGRCLSPPKAALCAGVEDTCAQAHGP